MSSAIHLCRVTFLLVTLVVAPAIAVAKSNDSLVTAVHSKVLNGYKRQKLPDGSFKPESYAIANGGAVVGTIRDASIERIVFPQLAGALGQQLARQNYFLAKDAKSADLLIVAYWGRTVPFIDMNSATAVNQLSSAMAGVNAANSMNLGQSYDALAIQGALNAAALSSLEDNLLLLDFFDQMRNRANQDNAQLLGYIDEMNYVNDIRRLSAGKHYYQDLQDDIEEPRYYLVILAYDFRETVHRNNRKLLWGTRVSIRTQDHAFDRDYVAMLAKAAKHFGQDSGGLLRRYDPKGRVDIGELEVLGTSPAAVSEKSKR